MTRGWWMVIFDPLTHADSPYEAPEGVTGGITGDTDKGLLAVYKVPLEIEDAFVTSLANCPHVLERKPL